MRRIEAVTGAGALGLRAPDGGASCSTAGERLRAGLFEVARAIEKLQAELRERDKEIEKLRASWPRAAGAIWRREARDVGGVRVLATRADVADPKALREVADS